MGKPSQSQNYRVSPKYGAHNFTCSHKRALTQPVKAGTRFTYPEG